MPHRARTQYPQNHCSGNFLTSHGCLRQPSRLDCAQVNTDPSENNDGEEPEYIFSGKCPNGDRYRLHLYKSDFEGSTGWYYNYQGPVGKGTVKTNTPPKTMAVRVCRGLAEIASDQL
jgi:hypothetical protein